MTDPVDAALDVWFEDDHAKGRDWRNHDPRMTVVWLAKMRRVLEAHDAALEESVKLQSHYAGLLNMYDGGQRLQFASADEWRTRLAAIEAAKEGK